MSNHYPKIHMKMNSYFHNLFLLFENVVHPAAGSLVSDKHKKRNSNMLVNPKATPDSLDIRNSYKNQGGFRRNPAP